jgi:VanZ family protein
VRYWLLPVLWCALIFFFSTEAFSSRHTASAIGAVVRFFTQGLSQERIGSIDLVVRKCGHVAEYFVLGVFLFRAFHLGSKGEKVFRSALLAAAVLALYAASDEFHQSFVPSRTASVMDVAIDSAGGAAAQIASVLWWKRPGAG